MPIFPALAGLEVQKQKLHTSGDKHRTLKNAKTKLIHNPK